MSRIKNIFTMVAAIALITPFVATARPLIVVNQTKHTFVIGIGGICIKKPVEKTGHIIVQDKALSLYCGTLGPNCAVTVYKSTECYGKFIAVVTLGKDAGLKRVVYQGDKISLGIGFGNNTLFVNEAY